MRNLFAIGALAVLAACSGPASGGAAATASDIPAVSTSSTSSMPASGGTTAIAVPAAILTPSDDLDATEIAALAVPPTSDVAPVGDAADAIEYNWNLTGNYNGIVKQWQDGVERRGALNFYVANTPPKPFFGGHGAIVIGQSSNVLMQGEIVATYKHSIALEFALSFGPGETCFASGIARRYRHVFEGVLRSSVGGSGCSTGANSTTYFKVHPSD